MTPDYEPCEEATKELKDIVMPEQMQEYEPQDCQSRYERWLEENREVTA